MAQLSDLTELINVVNAVQGKGETTTTSGGTTTERTQTKVSDKGVNQIIQNILAGKGGVRSIGNSARSAGMYDSTTEDMMMGDLYARAANQAELARSPTVRSTTVPEQTTMTAMPGMDPMSLALTLGGTSAMSSLLKGEIPFKDTYDSISGLFGGGGGGAGGGGGITDAIAGIFGGGGSSPAGGFMSQIGGTGAAASGGLGMSGGISSTAINAANSVAGSAGVGSAGGIYGNLGSGASAAGGSSMLSSFPGGGAGVASGIGGLLSGFSQEEEVLDSGGKLLATMGPAFAAGGPMGAAIAALGAIAGSGLSGGSIQDTIAGIPIVGDVLDPIIGGVRDVGRSIGDAVGTVICTALVERGLINKRQYKEALIHMHRVSPETLKGYQYWAVPVANKIKAGNKFWTNLWIPFVESRIALLRSNQSFVSHVKHPLGTVTKFGIEPVCTLIGKYLTWKEHKEVKAQGAY